MRYPQKKLLNLLYWAASFAVIISSINCFLSYRDSSNTILNKTYDMGYFKDIVLENDLTASILTIKEIPLDPNFDPTSVTDNYFTIKISGPKHAVENISIKNADHKLYISKLNPDKCSICQNDKVQINISYIDSLKLE